MVETIKKTSRHNCTPVVCLCVGLHCPPTIQSMSSWDNPDVVQPSMVVVGMIIAVLSILNISLLIVPFSVQALFEEITLIRSMIIEDHTTGRCLSKSS